MSSASALAEWTPSNSESRWAPNVGPVAGAAPEWYSEKAVSIGAYVVASGIFTVLGVQPPIFGSHNVVKLLAAGDGAHVNIKRHCQVCITCC